MSDRTLPVALVLGAAVWPGGEPSPTLARRTAHAVALYRTGLVGRIMGCGGLGRHPPTEASLIARLCREAGVPDDRILEEDRSTSTRENLINAKALLPDAAPVVIVTDPYHAPRARLIAWQIGLKATTSSPGWHQIGPKQRRRHVPREALALVATLLRLR
ncbi:YdcF family protein [Pararhodobacter sp.]|uniref:YdcF family protein n=1 Tax=Pararhodobacter sp. TaxID=2127056 RepID=UPI002FE0DE5A